jgi:hypothetical protein
MTGYSQQQDIVSNRLVENRIKWASRLQASQLQIIVNIKL